MLPDLITCAKGTHQWRRADGRRVREAAQIYDAFMQGPPGAIELFHGYTYSAHPIACAAGLATQQIYRGEGSADARSEERWRRLLVGCRALR